MAIFGATAPIRNEPLAAVWRPPDGGGNLPRSFEIYIRTFPSDASFGIEIEWNITGTGSGTSLATLPAGVSTFVHKLRDSGDPNYYRSRHVATGFVPGAWTAWTSAGVVPGEPIGNETFPITLFEAPLLASITPDAGVIYAGMLQDLETSPTAQIRLSTGYTITASTYLDLAATGSNPILQHDGLVLRADGSALFTDVIDIEDDTLTDPDAVTSWMRLRVSGLTHPFTGTVATDVAASFRQGAGASGAGGLTLYSFTDSSSAVSPFGLYAFRGYTGVGTAACFIIDAYKSDGATGFTTLAAGDKLFALGGMSGGPTSTPHMTMYGDGSIVVGNPTGGAKGYATINAVSLYLNGVAVGTGSIGGSGTVGTVARFVTDTVTLGDSSIDDDGTNATFTGNFTLDGAAYIIGGADPKILMGPNKIIRGQTASANFLTIDGDTDWGANHTALVTAEDLWFVIDSAAGGTTSLFKWAHDAQNNTATVIMQLGEDGILKVNAINTIAGTLLLGSTTRVSGGVLQVGADDSVAGTLSLYGPATLNDEGGEVRMYTGVDHDTTVDYYFIDAYQDDLRFAYPGNVLMEYQAGNNVWFFYRSIWGNYGNVSFPGYSFNGDSDLGMYRRAANSMGVSANGVNVATFNVSGLKINTGLSLGFNDAFTTRLYYSGGQIWYDDGGTNDTPIAGIKAITASATAPTGDYPWGTLHGIY